MKSTIEKAEEIRKALFSAYHDLTRLKYDENRDPETPEIEAALAAADASLGSALDQIAFVSNSEPTRKRA
jgi:hypothetical protein